MAFGRIFSSCLLVATLTFTASAAAQPSDETKREQTKRGDAEPEERTDLPEWRRYSPNSITAFSFGAFGAGAAAYFDDLGIGAGPGVDMPDVLEDKNARLSGLGWLGGGGVRGTLQSGGGFRFGLAVGAYRYGGGVELRHDPLPDGVTMRLESGGMVGIQSTLGKAFDAGAVYPYIDAMLLFNIVTAEIASEVAGLGHLGTTQLMAFSFGVAPRAGVFIPIDGDFFLDLSGHYGLFGVERVSAQIMFGIWDD